MTDQKKSPQPQGRKKGGTVFPRIGLEQAVAFSNKLVSKTHTGAQLSASLFPGVFGATSTSTTAAIRASALKQFGLMEGSEKDGFKATALAVAISTAVPEERRKALRVSCLSPRVFKALFDTFHGDSVAIAKLGQRASTEKVHPDAIQNCAEIFRDSALFAQLGKENGEEIHLVTAAELDGPSSSEPPETRKEGADSNAETVPGSTGEQNGQPEPERARSSRATQNQDEACMSPRLDGAPSARAIIHVNVTLDSSLDTDKLEKQLALLRRFGAI